MAKKPVYIFDKILSDAIRRGYGPKQTMTAAKWFRDKAKQMGKGITPEKLFDVEEDKLKSVFQYGRMYSFFYDPKHKKTLPYYDKFPLIFPIDVRPKGFLGINLHYLPLPMRAKLMDALYALRTNDRFDASTKLKISYAILNKAAQYSYFKPCVKYYLKAHIRSKFMRIESSEWNIALFLPTERFEKKSKTYVWQKSREIING